ncbi:MAG TPA: IS200/IS605 family transposase [Ferruginibacter sp.]|nr:IS200/IS605 family transposase [Ferruginibacter sp.]
MPNTYTQIHIQFVFAVKFRKAVIQPLWKEALHSYITGIIQNKTHKMLQINTMPDHLHMLIGFRPNDNMSQLIQVVKSESTKFINDHEYTNRPFSWQEGFGAFSYSKSHVANVIKYIQNQEQHHKKQTFLDEYVSFLEKFEIEYDERYIFKQLMDG